MNENIKNSLAQLAKINCDSLLISNPVNIKYLTGFKADSGYLLISKHHQPVYFTNFLYSSLARKIKTWQVVDKRGIFDNIIEKIKELKLTMVGFESKYLPFLEYKKIKENLNSAAIDFYPAKDLIENVRAIKNKQELTKIKQAISITESCFDFISGIYRPSLTEKNLSIEIEKFLKLKGDNEVAFKPIVAAATNSAFPHHNCRQTPLGGKFFLTDLGAKSYEYCADLTRVFIWDKMSLLFRRIYDTVRLSHDKAIKAIKDGVRTNQVDKAARSFIAKKGFGKYFGHGLGHGVGLEVHESPYLNPSNDEVLKEGMVITIEPAIYLPGKFGIRLENMILVKKEKGEMLSGLINW